MVILQETAVKFKNNLHVSHTDSRLFRDSGLLLVNELMDAFHFEDLIKQLIFLGKSSVLDPHQSEIFKTNGPSIDCWIQS